jgi:hypothetical protein
MARDLDPPLHLEADDFRDAIAGRGAVPLRFEFKQVGLVKAIEIGEGAFELSWSSDGGLVVNRQIISLRQFPDGGRACILLICPECGRPRKQLFLVSNRARGRGKKSYRFLCASKECSGVEKERKRRARNLEKQEEIAAGWAWKASRPASDRN